jgi:hypothetical protein
MVRLHADAIAENRASAEWTGGINCDNPNRLVLSTVLARDLVYQSAFACTGRTRHSDQHRPAREREQGFQQLGRFRSTILNQ